MVVFLWDIITVGKRKKKFIVNIIFQELKNARNTQLTEASGETAEKQQQLQVQLQEKSSQLQVLQQELELVKIENHVCCFYFVQNLLLVEASTRKFQWIF